MPFLGYLSFRKKYFKTINIIRYLQSIHPNSIVIQNTPFKNVNYSTLNVTSLFDMGSVLVGSGSAENYLLRACLHNHKTGCSIEMNNLTRHEINLA